MAGVNITNFGAARTNYLEGVTQTLAHQSLTRSLPKGAMPQNKKWTGDHLEWSLHVERSAAFGPTDDGGSFSAPDQQNYVWAKAYRKFVEGSVQITDGALASCAGTQHNSIDVVQSEVKGLMRDILNYENFVFTRDGTGTVTTLTGTTLATQVTDVPVVDARGLQAGKAYTVYDSTLATNRGDTTVANVEQALDSNNYALVNFDTGETVTGAVSGDYLVWKNGLNKCITGLESLIDDTSTTFQNVNTATYPRYTSFVMDNSSVNRPITPTLIRQMLAGIKQKAGMDAGRGLVVLTNNYQAIEFEELFQGDVRLTPSSKVGGTAVASFQSVMGKITVVSTPHMQYNKMFFMDPKAIVRGVQKKLHWRKSGSNGSVFERSDTAGVYKATALEICELFIKERHTSGRLDDLSETPLIAYA